MSVAAVNDAAAGGERPRRWRLLLRGVRGGAPQPVAAVDGGH